ncbi:hypothetical protein MMC13_000203 [Lambiella insularis]|nr:hypothetical protein [Lambiella insularis]
MTETNLSWPGERQPTRLDVEDANKVPEPTFLRDFKQALIASDIARDYQYALSPGSFGQMSRSPVNTSRQITDRHLLRQFTYPLALLSDFPDMPNMAQLGVLESSFWGLSKHLVFLGTMAVPSGPKEVSPPYLRLSLACLASCLSRAAEVSGTLSEWTHESRAAAVRALFVAGLKIWGVMLEVDNREARKVEAVMAISLLATYGTLTAEASLWTETMNLMGYTGPIVRRLHMHDFCAQLDKSTWRGIKNASSRSRCLLMCHLFLIDVVFAVHCNARTQYTSSELFITMPASNHNFQDVYTKLLRGEQSLPLNMTEAEDAVILLSALLSDIVTIHRIFSGFDLHLVELPVLQQSTSSESLPLLNPFVPFSPWTENQRMLFQLSNGLELWRERFQEVMSEDVLSLFYFCRLCLSFPQLLQLPRLARYKPAVNLASPEYCTVDGTITVPEDALRCVWLIVDHVNVERLPDRAACPVWLPVITYLSALVVWASLRSSSSSQSSLGTLKTLGIFKAELQQMPWPCCEEMIKNLDELMQVRG